MQSNTVGLLVYLVGATVTFVAQSPSQDELMRRLKLNQALYQQWDYGESLLVRQDRTGIDVFKAPKAIEDTIQCATCAPADINNHGAIKSATLLSDITVVGHVVKNITGATKREAFLYTDSELVIDEVLFQKSNQTSVPHVHERDEITITQPGGKIKRGEHIIEVQAPDRKRLTKDKSYLMFLKYLPESSSYQTIGLDGYDISDHAVVPLHPSIDPFSKNDLADRSSFLTGVRHSVIAAEAGGGK